MIHWWKRFHDPELDRALHIVLKKNFDILRAESAVKQARYTLSNAQSALYPQVDLLLGASHTIDHTSDTLRKYDLTSLSLQASYEVDLWGEIDALSRASLHNYRAKQFEYQTVYTTLACDVVTTWYTLAYFEENQEVLQGRLKLAKDEIKLLKKRYLAQEATSIDILSQQSQIKQIESELITLAYQKHTYRNILTVYLGDTKDISTLTLPEKLPEKLPEIKKEISLKTLLKRPDIRTAYENLKAEDAYAAAAISAQYPRFSLSASLKNSDIDNLLDQWYTTLAGSLVAPIFDANNRENSANLALEKRKASLLAFKQLLLKASLEVSDALKAYHTQQKLHTILHHQLKIDWEKANAYRMGYLYGTEDFKRYLDAKSDLRSTKEREIYTRLQLIESYITLLRVTAEGWSIEYKTEEKK